MWSGLAAPLKHLKYILKLLNNMQANGDVLKAEKLLIFVVSQ